MASWNIEQALADIKANSARLDGCPQHRVDPDTYKPGKKMKCLQCEGEIGAPELRYYILGYEAAGGIADDIWPGFRAPKG